MANFFDQFDAPSAPASPRASGQPATGNFFDQFDAQPPPKPQEPDSYGNSYFAQGTSGINEGIGKTLGLPVDVMNTALDYGLRGVNAIAGTDLHASEAPFLGSRYINGLMGDVGSIRPETTDPNKQMVRRVGQSVGQAIVPAGLAMRTAAAPVQVAAGIMLPAASGGATAAVADRMYPNNPTADMLADMAGSFGGVGAMAALAKTGANAAARAAVPTVQELKARASDLYKQAERSGLTATQAQTQQLASDLRSVASNEGLLSPTGRVSEAYPKAREALKVADDYANGPMTVPQMQTARKTLRGVARSNDDDEARIGGAMLRRFDDFTASLAPELAEARGIYHTAKKAQTLEQARELAEAKAGRPSGEAYAEALQSQYKMMDRQLIKSQMPNVTNDEQEAIREAARGTGLSRTAKSLGRFAPDDPRSYLTTAGVPFAVGSFFGGPMLGSTAAAGASALTYGARSLANKMQLSAVDAAELVARNGGRIPKGSWDRDTLKRLIAAAIATNAANLPPR